ncbi:MAG: S-methyl-5-thioribose-1-phosphate isomerase [Lachnospiraceae bacterium]|jgi:methylthioribose-1-phosphate isomerase|nr:S-methyl-5-thioribose-1-phosphate isomerase [Lachnospiraceae bacterium]
MRTVYWENDALYAIEQTLLPHEEKVVRLETSDAACDAIYRLAVRGAPAIGVTGAFAMVLAAREAGTRDVAKVLAHLEKESMKIGNTRPTATNLSWAVGRMMGLARSLGGADFPTLDARLLAEAQAIADGEAENARRICEYGATVIPDSGARILTHCETGPLCTIEHGLSTGVAIWAHMHGKKVHVYSDETRPRLQGAKLNIYELRKYGVPYTLLTDNMAGYAMQRGLVDMVFVSADRVARNGDTAAKIGVYGVCVLAQKHGIPVFLHAPMSTIDFGTATGDDIQIEERDPQEVLCINGCQIAPADTPVLNPAFDVTPHNHFAAIITERGFAYPPFEESLTKMRDRE